MTEETDSKDTPSKIDELKKIGRTLEEKRKSRGWTPERLAQSLKIRVSFVKAIEEGDWNELPGEVYGRGFVSRYAQLVGLDPHALLKPYLDCVTELDRKTSEEAVEEPANFSFPRTGFIWAGVGLIVLVALIKFITADLNSSKTQRALPVVQAEAPEPVTDVPPTPEPRVEAHTLEIYSPLPLWLSVKSETRFFEGFIPQASTWTWKGEGPMNVRLGHTQQVTLLLDGKPIALGENQKRFRLPREN